MNQHYPPPHHYGQQPPQWAPQVGPVGPVPPPVPAPKPKRSRGKLGALCLLVVGLFAACAVAGTSGSKTPQVPTQPTWNTATTAQDAPAVVEAPAPLQPARTITARDWSLIAKSPDQHAGERIVVYGEVEQFDATTGTEGFRANVDGVVHKPEYGYADYKTNTILHGDTGLLQQVVEKDLFKAEVTVAGSMSYETTMGGNLTVPKLTVTKIDVIGHTD